MQKYPCLYRKGNKGYNRSSRLELFCRKGVLRNFAKFKASNFIKKQTPAQVFSCEFCDISKNIVFYRTPPVAASDTYRERQRVTERQRQRDRERKRDTHRERGERLRKENVWRAVGQFLIVFL